MKHVLVTGGDSRVAYSVCRTLSKLGYTVSVGYSSKKFFTADSKYCHKKIIYTSYSNDEQIFINDIIEFIKENSVDILIPTLDETFTISKYSHLIKEHTQLLVPEYEKIMTAHDKVEISKVAEKLNISVPKTWDLIDIISYFNSHKMTISDLPFPIIIKPKKGGGGWNTFTYYNEHEFTNFLTNVSNPEIFMVQQFIVGQLVGACTIYNNGNMIASDMYSVIKTFPVKVGQATRRESIASTDVIIKLKTILDHLQWTGVCEMDFIVESTTGKPFLLDVNPRFWGSIENNITAGINYPLYYCKLAFGETNFTIPNPSFGVKTRWIGGDIMRTLAEIPNRKDKLFLIKDLFFPKDIFLSNDDWDIKDPLPFLKWLIKNLIKKIKKK